MPICGDSGGSGDTTTQQTVRPFPAQERALKRVFEQSLGAFKAGPQEYFPGQTVADQSQNTLLGQQAALGAISPLQAIGGQAKQGVGKPPRSSAATSS